MAQQLCTMASTQPPNGHTCLRQPVASQLTRMEPLALEKNNDNHRLQGICHMPGVMQDALLGGPHLGLTVTGASGSYYCTEQEMGV